VFEEILTVNDRYVADKMLRDWDPYEYVMKYPAIHKFLDGLGRGGCKPKVGPRFDPDSWRVPQLLLDWKRDNVDLPSTGRKVPLLLIGPSRTGKTEWAESFGNPIIMTKRWNMAEVREGATHIVVNDVDVRSFGSGGDSYWREVLGCQRMFSACDRYRPTEMLAWNLGCVWTCNKDSDPRRYKAPRLYLKQTGAIIVEIEEPLYVDSKVLTKGGRAEREGENPPDSTEERKSKKVRK
jgi:hypothetical protein